MRLGIEIQGGERRGFKLKAPKGVRPTQSLVKRSLFDRLGPWIREKKVLELYAGSGAVGFEALSRGAEHVTFVDRSRGAIEAIKENARKLGYSSKIRIFKKESMRALRELREKGEKFDFIFADPPYGTRLNEDFSSLIADIMDEDGLFVLEVRWKERGEVRFKHLELEKEVKLGESALLIYRRLSW